ncbi:MAG TPA: serine/threonine protein kinase [Kofleriaceae bacterium]|nr:serine/threonine protein kinase [Kofleriaceae bacterium]
MAEDRRPGLEDTAAVSPPSPAATSTEATVAAASAGETGNPVRLPEVSPKRYQIDGEIGRGGLGRVLRAHDVFLDRAVAVKELHEADDLSRRRFVREALITARLQHPSIVPVYEAGRWPDRAPFYAMKLVAGRPLAELIADAKTLDARLALLPNVLDVADAIAYAHGERIIHRDLKPHNVLVGAHGETIVIDWGLAKDLAVDDRDALDAGPYRDAAGDQTMAGALLGTPAYMAPEQASGGDCDERADVYALGAMLYHVITGAGPHGGETLDVVIARIVAGDIVPLRRREPNVRGELAAIVAKAMARDRADRYPTARELADDLRRFATDQLVGAHRYTIAQRVRRWLRRHRALVAAVLVLCGFAAWSAIMVRRQRDTALIDARRELVNQVLGIQHDVAFSLDQADVLLPQLGALADPSLPRDVVGPRMIALAVGRPGVSNVSVGFPSGAMWGTFAAADGTIGFHESVIEGGQTHRTDFVVDGAGLRPTSEELSTYDVRTRPHYTLAVSAKRRAWTPPRTFFTSHATGLTCTEPVYAADATLRAVLTVDFDVASMSSFIQHGAQDGARTIVFTGDGTILAFPSAPVPAIATRESRLLRHEDYADPAVEALFRAIDPRATAQLQFVELDAGDDDYLAAIAPIGGERAGIAAPLDWYGATIVPERALLGPARRRERQMFEQLALGAGAIGLGAIALAIARRAKRRRRA